MNLSIELEPKQKSLLLALAVGTPERTLYAEGTSPREFKLHRQALLDALESRSDLEAVLTATESGLINSSDYIDECYSFERLAAMPKRMHEVLQHCLNRRTDDWNRIREDLEYDPRSFYSIRSKLSYRTGFSSLIRIALHYQEYLHRLES